MRKPHITANAMLTCVIALLIASVGAPARAVAARKAAPHVKVKIISNGGGNRLDVVVRVRTAARRIGCRGRARQAHLSAPLPRLRTGAKGGAQWHWFAGDGTPPAKLKIRVRCSFPDHKSRRRTVAKSIGSGPFYGKRTVRHLIRPGSLKIERWNPPTDQEGSGEGGADLYPRGQCTWYVATQRPDLPYFQGRSGDAKNWIRSAQKQGIPTGPKPRRGAVAVFKPGQYQAGAYGHVAYVTAVDGKMITITEANFRRKPIGHKRTIGWQNLRFIYEVGDDAEPTRPGSPPPSPAVSMATARVSHTATPLRSGKVLVTGGRPDGTSVTPSAELYDPASSAWMPMPNMTSARIFHTATLLQDGKVLVTGGQTSLLSASATGSAELYDPTSNTWTPVPTNMTSARHFHTATLLLDGKVLVTGISDSSTASAELYDPTSNTWLAVPNMTPRIFHTATRLEDGKVLVTGISPTANGSAELYNPTSNTWSAVPNMTSPRSFHTATLLKNGKVLVTGGTPSGTPSGSSSATASADLYDPATNTWTPVPNMTSPRSSHTATRLEDGKVLVTGGTPGGGSSATASAELYDPATNTWTPTASLATPRAGHTATLLPGSQTVLITGGDPSGTILATGGESSTSASATASTELYHESPTR